MAVTGQMTIVHLALVLSSLTFLGHQSAPPPAAPAVQWPVEGVVPVGTPGVSMPRLISEVKPNYTAQAMRERIHGVVVLECIVELDGTVGQARIIRSLDAVHGLDTEALRAIKLWRFIPAMRDGTPVRTAVTIEMSFAIGEPAETTATMGWPVAFSNTSEVPSSRPPGWSEETIATPALQFRVAVPAGWSLNAEPSRGALVLLQADDPQGHRTIRIAPLQPTTLRVVKPLSPRALKAFLDSVGGRSAAQTRNVTMVASGQVRTPDVLWLWLEMAAPVADLPNAPPQIAEHMRVAHDGLRMWIFTTTAEGQYISVTCSLLHAANSTNDQKREEIQRAGLEFGAILQRLSIRPR